MGKEYAGLHIDVGQGILNSGKVDIYDELPLIKSAILYGDSTTVHSPKVKAISLMNQFVDSFSIPINADSIRGLLPHNSQEFFRQVEEINVNIEELRLQMANFEATTDRASRRSNKMYQKLKKSVLSVESQSKRQLMALLKNTFDASGISELNFALARGNVNLKDYDVNFENERFAEEYIDSIFKIVSDNIGYPMFDREMANLIDLGIKEGRLAPKPSTEARGKQIALSTAFVQQLPHFPMATMKEIIDIRKRLSKPLTRFRSAMQTYSSEIQSAPWSADFASDAEQMYISKVSPLILDIQEQVRENNIYKSLGTNFINKGASAAVMGVLSIGVANLSGLAEAWDKSYAGIAAAAATLSTQVFQTHQAKSREIERNQMYFLYELDRKMKVRG